MNKNFNFKEIQIATYKEKFFIYLLFIVILLNIFFINNYIFFEYQNYFHSDSATKNLLAQEIFETGEYFPKDWNYANSDLWVFFGHTFIIPMLFFTENSFFLHGLSGLISAALIVLSTYLVASLLSKNTIYRLISIAIITSGISPLVAENLYGQVSYGAVFYLSGFIIFFSVKSIFDNTNKKYIWNFCLFIILLLVFFMNPSRALITYALPLLFSITFLYIYKYIKNETSKTIELRYIRYLFVVCILAMLIGIILHLWVISTVNNIPGASSALWLSFNHMLRNIGLTLYGLFSIFGAVPTPSASIKTVLSGYEALRLISALLLIGVTVYGFKYILKNAKEHVKFIAVYVSTSLSFVLFLHITTTIPDMMDPVQSARYLIPSSLLVLMVMLSLIFTDKVSNILKSSLIILAIIFITSAPYALKNLKPLEFTTEKQQNNLDALIKYLKSKDLKYGYATYWNAGNLTILSNDKIKIRPVHANGIPQPFRHLSSDRWYQADAWKGKTFILLTEDEAKNIDLKSLKEIGIVPIDKYIFNNWIIYVFEDNIASHIVGWDYSYYKKVIILPSLKTLHNVGSFIELNNNPIIYAKENERGFLHYGPYIRIAEGKYRAIFELKVEKRKELLANYGTVDIASSQGSVIHANAIIDGTKQNIVLDFNITGKTDFLEFRVFSNGNGNLSLSSISFMRLEKESK